MFVSHVVAGFAVVILYSFFFIWQTKKVVDVRVRQVVVFCSNDFLGISLGGLSIGRLIEVAIWTDGCTLLL